MIPRPTTILTVIIPVRLLGGTPRLLVAYHNNSRDTQLTFGFMFIHLFSNRHYHHRFRNCTIRLSLRILVNICGRQKTLDPTVLTAELSFNNVTEMPFKTVVVLCVNTQRREKTLVFQMTVCDLEHG